MIINGKEIPLSRPTTLSEFLQSHGYKPRLVAVERGGEVVKQSAYDTTIITDADKLEIVSFVGGG